MDTIHVYRKTRDYAASHNEIEAYTASFRANEECRDAIKDAIAKHYYAGSLGNEAAREVIAVFGQERVEYVLAIIVASYGDDPHISRSNFLWARNVHFAEERYNSHLMIDYCPPGLIEQFTTAVCEEAEISRTLYQDSDNHAREDGKLEQYRASRHTNTPLAQQKTQPQAEIKRRPSVRKKLKEQSNTQDAPKKSTKNRDKRLER